MNGGDPHFLLDLNQVTTTENHRNGRASIHMVCSLPQLNGIKYG